MSDFGWGVFIGTLIGMFLLFIMYIIIELCNNKYNEKQELAEKESLQNALIKRYNKVGWNIFNQYAKLRLENNYIELSWEDFKLLYNDKNEKFEIISQKCNEFDIELNDLGNIQIDEIRIPCIKEERGRGYGSTYFVYIPILFSEARYVTYWLVLNKQDNDKKRDKWQQENRKIDTENEVKAYINSLR